MFDVEGIRANISGVIVWRACARTLLMSVDGVAMAMAGATMLPRPLYGLQRGCYTRYGVIYGRKR